ncbi:MAG TPA: hypothetical protein VIO15_02535 [Bacteroidales bacterium]
MNFLRGKSILIFAPRFFGYEIEIKNKLEELGAEVHLYDERPSNNFIVKVLIRINPVLLYNRIYKHYKNIIERHRGSHFDYILFFKGETVSKELIISLKESFTHAKVVLYLIDSLRNYPHLKGCLDLFDKALSFDLSDTQNFSNLNFRPLFFLDEYANIGSNNESSKYDILFIGTVHSDRWVFLNKIKSIAEAKGLKVKYYLYFQSPVIFWWRKIFNKSYWTIPFRYAEFISLPKSKVIEYISQSTIIVDIQHPKQTGLTMRTIEVLGANRKLITTNDQISRYDFYNSSNILIADRSNPIIDDRFLQSKYIKPDISIYEKYSLEKWVFDILK